MSRMLRILTAGLVCSFAASLAACGDDDTVKITLFQASPDAIEAGQSTTLLFAVEPATARVDISGLGDQTGHTSAAITPTATTSYQLTAVNGSATANQTVMVTVGPTSASAIKVEPASSTPTAGDQLAVTVTALASNGKAAPGFRGTVHMTSTDAKAVLPADFTFAAADAGVKHVMVTLETAGTSTLTATDTTAKAGVQGSASLTVRPGAASTFTLSALPATASAGQSLALSITARDTFGNVATGFTGKAKLTSTDPTDILPPATDCVAGQCSVSLAFTKVGNHTAAVADEAATITAVNTTSVAVGPGAPFQVVMAATNASTTAGTPEAFTATVVDFYNNVATNYTGTLHFAAIGDPIADVPPDFTFAAGDAGAHSFSATLKTAGSVSVAAGDTVAAVSGTATWTVGAAAAATCIASQAPATTVAGTQVGLTVGVRDQFNNVASGYTGTIAVSATDVRASLPAAVTYAAGDAGSHAFPVQLITTGTQTVTATDTTNAALTCTATIVITPAAPKLVLTVPADANAGYAVNVGVAVVDIFDNARPGYIGIVAFTSTDNGTGAVNPANITFTGTENGVASTTATFVTIGAQTLSGTATDATSSAIGTTAARVHGLVYTGPSSGRVRLVANAAQSNSQVVQLDLVANERLEVSTFFGGGPGSFAAGMNLPLDTTRVMADAALFAPGPALPPGAGTRAAVGRLGSDHVLYTGVSRKRIAGTVFTQETEVQAGGVFYSVRLKLTQAGTIGPVFDGAQPLVGYRAAVRDQWGDDFVSQSDIGVGKLEVR
jgi:hypothetical protein